MPELIPFSVVIPAIDDDFYEELEEILIMGDIGINATISNHRESERTGYRTAYQEPGRVQAASDRRASKNRCDVDSTEYAFENQKSVILVIGVNGVGKTTSVGKLAGKLKDQGKKVILAAADTFRAAAGEQLDTVGKPCRCGSYRRTGRR